MKSQRIIFSDIILREYSDSDAEEFTNAILESVESVGHWMPWCSRGYTVSDALQWFSDCRKRETAGAAYEYGVFSLSTGKFLGGAGLNALQHQHKLCNLGYWVRQTAQRQGVASKCVQALSHYAFHQLGLHRIEIVVAVGNTASERVAVKAGAVHECIARNRLYFNGAPMPAHVFSLVPS
jgi:RimJ/RimL family protein N-acetyltransferase